MIIDYIFISFFLYTTKKAVILLSCEGPWWTHQWELRLNQVIHTKKILFFFGLK